MATNYDLGALRVFVAVYKNRSVTAAADSLFVAQPTVSYALGKLRRHFGDELFVRRNQQLMPTRMADFLYPQLREILERLDTVMHAADAFDPAVTTRTFRLMLSDAGVTGLLPKILAALDRRAPFARVEVVPLVLSRAAEALRLGDTDAVVCTQVLGGDDLDRTPLFTQPYLGVRRPDHPRIGSTPSLAEFEGERHVAVAMETGHTAVDLRIRELGIRRDVALTLPSFTGLPGVLVATDYLGFAPRTYAERSARLGEVALYELPFEVANSAVSLYTLRHDLPSPDTDWLRELVVETLGDPSATGASPA